MLLLGSPFCVLHVHVGFVCDICDLGNVYRCVHMRPEQNVGSLP